MGALTIETRRLLVRPVRDADAEVTAALCTPDIARRLGTWRSPMEAADAKRRIDLADERLHARIGVYCAVLDRESGVLMGWISLIGSDAGTCSFGYWIGTKFQNRGYMTEAATAFLPRAASYLGRSALEALVQPDNVPSIRILTRLEFELEGEVDDFVQSRNRIERVLLYRREWQPG